MALNSKAGGFVDDSGTGRAPATTKAPTEALPANQYDVGDRMDTSARTPKERTDKSKGYADEQSDLNKQAGSIQNLVTGAAPPKSPSSGGGGTPSSGGGGGAGGAPAGGTPEAETPAEEPAGVGNADPLNTAGAAQTTANIVSGATPESVAVNPLDHVDSASMQSMLEQINNAAQEQATNKIDYATQQGVNELERGVEDAAAQFQTQRDQIAADEQTALDNQALYAQARGDNGGLGQAQYGSIQNNAATNRLTVNREQTKLATDTARQIADLRAQGEYQKADAMLEITQSFLSQLMSLEKWAIEANVSIDEFNAQLAQWQNNYNLQVKEFVTGTELSTTQMTGAFADGTTTLGAREALNQQLATAAQALLSQGIDLTEEQIAALGWSPEQYTIYKTQQQASAASGGTWTPPSNVIKEFQRAYNEAHPDKPIAVDGHYGPETAGAIENDDALYRKFNI